MEQAIEDYLAEKRGTLDAHKESTKLTIQKIGGILRPLAPFLRDRGVVHLKDVKTEHLSVFQETWQGRLRKNRESDGKLVRQPKSQLRKQKNQEFVKMYFRRARELRWIPENRAELLLAVKTPRIDVKKKTPEGKQKLLEAIPRVFPNIAQVYRVAILPARLPGVRALRRSNRGVYRLRKEICANPTPLRWLGPTVCQRDCGPRSLSARPLPAVRNTAASGSTRILQPDAGGYGVRRNNLCAPLSVPLL